MALEIPPEPRHTLHLFLGRDKVASAQESMRGRSHLENAYVYTRNNDKTVNINRRPGSVRRLFL